MKKYSLAKAVVFSFALLASLSATAAPTGAGIEGSAGNQDNGDNLQNSSPWTSCNRKLIINSFKTGDSTFNKPKYIIDNTFKFVGPTITVCAHKGETFQVGGRFGIYLQAIESRTGSLRHDLCVRGIEPRSILHGLRFREAHTNIDSILTDGKSQTFSDLDYFTAPETGRYELGICTIRYSVDFGDDDGTLHLSNSMISALRIE